MAISTRYRHQVKYFLVKKCWQRLNQWCHRHQNNVQPIDAISRESGSEPDQQASV